MKLVLSLYVLINLLSFCHANTYTPNRVSSLVKQDTDYSVVLFYYFQRDYQSALKEIALIDTSLLEEQDKQAHNYFKNVILMSQGAPISIHDLILNDGAALQAILIAARRHVAENEWGQAQELLNSIKDKLSLQQSNDYHYLQGKIALFNQDDGMFKNELSQINKNSQEFALLIQHAKVNGNAASIANFEKNIDITSHQSIKEQILLTQAIDFLKKNKPQLAIKAAGQISLTSPLKNSVALVYGAALNQHGQYAQAISLFDRILNSDEHGSLGLDARLAKAYAFEQLGDEQSAYKQLDEGLELAQKRLLSIPILKIEFNKRSECIVNLLTNIAVNYCNLAQEARNESLLSLLATPPFLKANEQFQDLSRLNLEYNQHLQSISSFDFLLKHQITTISQLLNKEKIISLESTIADITAGQVAIVNSVDHAEDIHNGHFFLSKKYLELQKRIDETFSRMVFLKRAGQKNMASERRVSLLQKIVWWHSFSNFDKHLLQTREQIALLNKQLTNNNTAYQILQDYLLKIDMMNSQLERITHIKHKIERERSYFPAIKASILMDINARLSAFWENEERKVSGFIVNAKLAKVRIEDTSFNRFIEMEAGIGN